MGDNDQLSFEYAPDSETLEIHGCPEAFRKLAEDLLQLARSAAGGSASDHLHYFSEEWGGDSLAASPQSIEAAARCFQHVKVVVSTNNSSSKSDH